MSRFLQAAIQNMEYVETDYDRERQNPDRRQAFTQEAIAYALIAIAEAMQIPTVETVTTGEAWTPSDWNRTNEGT